MENASKALMIAAGVLIGLIILSLAAYLFFNFASTSREVHNKVEQDQINQFNAQFTEYESREDVTFYDVITVTNLAINNNENKSLTENSTGNDYITVSISSSRNNNSHLERSNDTVLNNMLSQDIALLQNGELPTYKCTVTISDITRRVKKITFNEI